MLNIETSNLPKGRFVKVPFVDYCDCFDIICPGCHFPCRTCNSPKCGVDCRVNRKVQIDSITFDGKATDSGTEIIIKRPVVFTLLKEKPADKVKKFKLPM